MQELAGKAKDKKFGKNLRAVVVKGQKNLLELFSEAHSKAEDAFSWLEPVEDARKRFLESLQTLKMPLDLSILNTTEYKTKLWGAYWIALIETQLKKNAKSQREVA